MAQPKPKPKGTVGLVIGVILVLLGIVGGIALVVGGAVNLANSVNDFQRVSAATGGTLTLKSTGTHYMFYEAYGTYATAVNRFFHPSRGDSWTTHGFPQETADWNDGYTADRRIHGFAPRYAKAHTHPIYSGEIVYSLPTGPKANRFLRQTPVQNAAGVRPLNGGEPVFWLYDSPGPGRQPLFSFWGSLHWNTFTSTDPAGEGVPGAVPDFAASAEMPTPRSATSTRAWLPSSSTWSSATSRTVKMPCPPAWNCMPSSTLLSPKRSSGTRRSSSLSNSPYPISGGTTAVNFSPALRPSICISRPGTI